MREISTSGHANGYFRNKAGKFPYKKTQSLEATGPSSRRGVVRKMAGHTEIGRNIENS